MEIITLEEAAFYEIVGKVIAYVKSNIVQQEKWVHPGEAMRLLNITSKTTLQKMRNEGKIRYSQPTPKNLLYDRESINKFLEQHACDTF